MNKSEFTYIKYVVRSTCTIVRVPMEYPIVLLDSWLLDLISSSSQKEAIYSNPVLAKSIIAFEGPDQSNLKTTPVLRVYSFTKLTESGELTAVLNDASNKVLALFTKECILNFESRFAQRITYHTVNSLLLVKRALLRFLTLRELRQKFGVVDGLRVSPNIAIVYLEISEVEFFHREQARVASLVENTLRFVYSEPQYGEKFGQKNASDEKARQFVFQWQDEIVSDEEDIPAGALKLI